MREERKIFVIFIRYCGRKMPKLPKFLKKLVQILSDSNFQHIVAWREDNTSFEIFKPNDFTEHVLPSYFKHRNLASFVRQLNMYGFSRHKDSNQHTYYHPKFRKGHINSIRCIQRKKKPQQEEHSSGSSSLSHEKVVQIHSSDKQGQQDMLLQTLMRQNIELKNTNKILQEKIKKLEKEIKLEENELAQNSNNAFPEKIPCQFDDLKKEEPLQNDCFGASQRSSHAKIGDNSYRSCIVIQKNKW